MPQESFGAEHIGTLTPRAQQVLMLARKEADKLNHNFVGTEHLLLGLIKLGQGVAVNVLGKMGSTSKPSAPRSRNRWGPVRTRRAAAMFPTRRA